MFFNAILMVLLTYVSPSQASVHYKNRSESAAVKAILEGISADLAALQIPSSSKLNLVLAAEDSDSSEETMGYQIRRMETFLDGPILYSRVDSWPEVAQLLRTNRSEMIQSLYVDFHGNENGILIDDETLHFNSDDIKKTLGDVHMAPGALVVLTSCHVIPKSKEEALLRFRELRDGLNMQSGFIYLNYEKGSSDVDDVILTPFYHRMEEATTLDKVAKVTTQLFPPVGAIYWVKDYILTNHGYIYGFDQRRNLEVLLPSHLFNARRGIIKN